MPKKNFALTIAYTGTSTSKKLDKRLSKFCVNLNTADKNQLSTMLTKLYKTYRRVGDGDIRVSFKRYFAKRNKCYFKTYKRVVSVV